MDKKEKTIGSWSFIKRMLGYAKPYRLWVILSVLMAILGTICDISGVFLIKQVIDNIHSNNHQIFANAIMFFIIISLLSVVSKFFATYSSGKFGTLIIRDLRAKAVHVIENMPASEVEKNHSGDTVSRMTNDIVAVENFMVNDFSEFLYLPILIITAFSFLFFLNWKLVLLSLIPLPFFMYLTNRLSMPMRKYSAKFYEHLGEVNSIVQDAVDGINIIKLFKLEKPLYGKCSVSLHNALIQGIKMVKKNALVQSLSIMSCDVPFAICFAAGGYIAIKGGLSPGALIAFLQMFSMIIFPLAAFPKIIASIRNSTGAAGRVFEVLDQQVERTDGSSFRLDGNEGVALEFSNVSFEYIDSKSVLHELSFKVLMGMTTALVGPSGCGKSTVMNLISSFYQADSGSIKLFGKDIKLWSLAAIRENLALVSQDSYLFPTTIEENIRFGRITATKEEIIEAAIAANAHEFIMELPDKYSTPVGERGIKLSGGQRQRISIARAILKNAPILLLDEPTSALDTQSEALVQDALEKYTKNRTVLVIAHRLSTIKNADSLLVLNEGKIAESGTHEELLDKGGLYKQLYLKQFISSDEEVILNA